MCAIREPKKCEYCGKEYIPKSNNSKYCPGPHYATCPICGKTFEITNDNYLRNPIKSCSDYKCRREATKRTSLEKYGTTAPGASKQARAKASETMMKNLGVPYAMMSKEVRDKSKKTLLEKYGVDNASKNEEIKKKRHHTVMKKYSRQYLFNSEATRQKQTMMEQYGVTCTCLLPSAQTDNVKSKINYKFLKFLQSNRIDVSESDMEFHIGTRSYDFKIPNSNILVEINPTYTHNSFGNHFNKNGIDSNYHLMKSKLAKENGYRCIHVWDWDDWNKIVPLVRTTQNRVYARNTEIYVVKNKKLTNKFLNDNHIQGTVRGQELCFGLVHNDELIELMTFGKPRYNRKFNCELLRLCTKQDTVVVGGASKLFSYATKYFSLGKIISYCDLSKFNGNVYEKLNMTLDHTTSPTKIWSQGDRYVTSNMLASRGFDQLFKTNYGKGTDNEILMLEHGWLPVPDCGQAVYTFDCGL